MMGKLKFTFHTVLDEERNIVIPVELCQRYGFQRGMALVLESTESGIVLRSLASDRREGGQLLGQIRMAEDFDAPTAEIERLFGSSGEE